MSYSYKPIVNHLYDFDISEDDIKQLDLVVHQDNTSHLLHNQISYEVSILESNFLKKNYNVRVNHNIYSVHIQDALDLLIHELGFDQNASEIITKVIAPMPGIILNLHVAPGDVVSENDPLLILEAMKMENIITSPRAGTIKSVAVKNNDTVDKNTLLIEFE